VKVRPTRALELRDNGSSRGWSESNSARDSSFAARVEGSSVLIAIPRPQPDSSIATSSLRLGVEFVDTRCAQSGVGDSTREIPDIAHHPPALPPNG
jgi:hypothetical protein